MTEFHLAGTFSTIAFARLAPEEQKRAKLTVVDLQGVYETERQLLYVHLHACARASAGHKRRRAERVPGRFSVASRREVPSGELSD